MGEKGLMCWDERKLSNERLDFYHNSTKNERKQKKKKRLRRFNGAAYI